MLASTSCIGANQTDRKSLPFSTDKLNNYFSSITANSDRISNIDIAFHSTPDSELRRFYFSHITLDIFLKAFYQLKSTSVGSDLISWNLLETFFSLTFPNLPDIFNHSLTNSVFSAI